MSDKSSIEWTDASWNPIRALDLNTGKIGWHCEHATTGCEFCYSESFNKRLGTGVPFKPGHRSHVTIFLDDKMLTLPLRWKKPRKIFVCSMTDLFADFVTDEWIDKIFAVMALCPQHTFQVLTKRAERMRAWVTQERKRTPPVECIAELYVGNPEIATRWPFDQERAIGVGTRGWPLPNVWLGISCERQEEADERIPHLLQTPAAVRFISAEPLLGPIDLTRIKCDHPAFPDDRSAECDALIGSIYDCADYPVQASNKLDWVIVGGESGKGAREHDLQWTRDIVAQCRRAGVACFVKQLGANVTGPHENGVNAKTYRFKHSKGGDPSEWPQDLRVREFPTTVAREVAA